jgi:hypothetical protein
MQRLVSISVLLFSLVSFICAQGTNRQGVLIIGKITPNLEISRYTIKEVEKGFPVTFTSDEKSDTIDKCKIIQSESLIYIEIFGEGVGKEWINENGDIAVVCAYIYKSTEANKRA